MTTFLGKHKHTIDAKGRLSIPSKFRKATGEVFVLTLGLDKCLFFYPADEWRNVVKELRTLRFTNRKTRFFTRQIASHACEVTVDGHGRIMVPQELRDLAGLEKDVLVVGAVERIEIWNPDEYAKYNNEFGLTYEQVAETLWEEPETAHDDEVEE